MIIIISITELLKRVWHIRVQTSVDKPPAFSDFVIFVNHPENIYR
jgi:hypothetical protein